MADQDQKPNLRIKSNSLFMQSSPIHDPAIPGGSVCFRWAQSTRRFRTAVTLPNVTTGRAQVSWHFSSTRGKRWLNKHRTRSPIFQDVPPSERKGSEMDQVGTTLDDLPEDVQWTILKVAVTSPKLAPGVRASRLRGIRGVNRSWRQFCQSYVTTLHVAWKQTRKGPADSLAGVVQRQSCKLETLDVVYGPAKWTQTMVTIWRDVIPLVEWRRVDIRGIPRKTKRNSDNVRTAYMARQLQSAMGGLLLSPRLTASKLVKLTVLGFVGQDRMDFAADLAQVVARAPCLRALHIDDNALDLNHFLGTVRPSERLKKLRLEFVWVWNPKELTARREALDRLGEFVNLTSLKIQSYESRAELVSWGRWTQLYHGTRSPGYKWDCLSRLPKLETFIYHHTGSKDKRLDGSVLGCCGCLEEVYASVCAHLSDVSNNVYCEDARGRRQYDELSSREMHRLFKKFMERPRKLKRKSLRDLGLRLFS